MDRPDEFVVAVFCDRVPEDQLRGLGSLAQEKIARRLRDACLFDTYSCDVLLSTVTESVSRQLDKIEREGTAPIESFPSYFLTACDHAASTYARRERRREWVPLPDLEAGKKESRGPGLSVPPLLSLVDEARAFELLRLSLEALGERERLLARNALCAPRRDQELASELGLSLETLRVAMCRALKKLRIELQKRLDKEPTAVVDPPPSSPTPGRGSSE